MANNKPSKFSVWKAMLSLVLFLWCLQKQDWLSKCQGLWRPIIFCEKLWYTPNVIVPPNTLTNYYHTQLVICRPKSDFMKILRLRLQAHAMIWLCVCMCLYVIYLPGMRFNPSLLNRVEQWRLNPAMFIPNWQKQEKVNCDVNILVLCISWWYFGHTVHVTGTRKLISCWVRGAKSFATDIRTYLSQRHVSSVYMAAPPMMFCSKYWHTKATLQYLLTLFMFHLTSIIVLYDANMFYQHRSITFSTFKRSINFCFASDQTSWFTFDQLCRHARNPHVSHTRWHNSDQ